MKTYRAVGNSSQSPTLPLLEAHWQDISIDYALKLNAMQRYESQFPAFFQGPAECETLHRRHAKDMGGNDGLYEVFWNPIGPANGVTARSAAKVESMGTSRGAVED